MRRKPRLGSYGSCLLLPILAVFLTACAPAFNIERLTAADHAPVDRVVVLRQEPAEAYEILARFSGTERRRCPRDEPYCSLRDEARKIGADAIWVQKSNVYKYPGEWIVVEGRATHIRGFESERIEGVLVRFLRN